MKRGNKEVIVENKPTWRKKVKTGKHIMPDGRELIGRETIRAYEDELRGAADKFDLIDPGDGIVQSEPDIPEATLIMKHMGGGKYQVVNTETGQPITDALVTKEQAEGMVNGIVSDDGPGPVNEDGEADDNGDPGDDEGDDSE